MGSTFILKARTCLKSSQLLLHTGGPAFSPLNPPQARFLYTRDLSLTLGVRQTHRSSSGQGGVKNSFTRRGEDDSPGNGGGDKRFSLRQKPLFPKSVFAAGTARRTAEMQRRKVPLVCEDEEEPKRRTDRGEGEKCRQPSD